MVDGQGHPARDSRLSRARRPEFSPSRRCHRDRSMRLCARLLPLAARFAWDNKHALVATIVPRFSTLAHEGMESAGNAKSPVAIIGIWGKWCGAATHAAIRR